MSKNCLKKVFLCDRERQHKRENSVSLQHIAPPRMLWRPLVNWYTLFGMKIQDYNSHIKYILCVIQCLNVISSLNYLFFTIKPHNRNEVVFVKHKWRRLNCLPSNLNIKNFRFWSSRGENNLCRVLYPNLLQEYL